MKILQDFENYLKKVQLSQKVMIYFMPIIIIGGLMFMYLLPTQEEELDMLESETMKLQSNIKRKSPRVAKKKITQSKKRLFALTEETEKNRDSLNYLYAKLTNLESLEFDETRWTATLDEILKKSLNLHLKIKNIKNSNSKRGKTDDKVVPKKYVEITGSGKYSAVLKYLNFIETRQFLVDVKNIKIEKKADSNDIDFNFNFTIYGVNI